MAYPHQVQKQAPPQWSIVEKTPITLEKVNLLTHSLNVLRKEGYVLEALSEPEIRRKMKCQNCGKKIQGYRPPAPEYVLDYGDDHINTIGREPVKYPTSDLTARQQYASEVAKAAQSTWTEKHHCFFHDGQQFKGVWQCCGGRFNTKGCCSNIDHVAGDIDELRAEWSLYRTPHPANSVTSTDIKSVPGLDPTTRSGGKRGRSQGRYTNSYSRSSANQSCQSGKSIRSVVALDCEMGTSRLGNTELIRLSLIDFFTQESLIDSLVLPTVEMTHYNTRYSGVTFGAMRHAVRTNTAIRGAAAARNEVFKYVDSETIVIVHGGCNDFSTMRWIHPATRIIDTCVLETYDHKVKENGWKKSLKEVCLRRCGISVQNAVLNNGRTAGHDSLEDAFATREVVCWWLKMIPDQ